jgi:Flp pilus assembly protein TadD
MARVESQSGNYREAVKYFREIIDQERTNKYAWLFLAFALNDMDSTDAAEKTYKDALVLFPKDADIWSFYGSSLQGREAFEEAVSSFKKALSLDPANTNALTSLPVIYERLEMFAQCDSLYEAALKHLPDNDLILNNFSYSLSERDLQLERALEMAKKAVSKRPKNAAYLDTIGWIYYKLGDYVKAEKYIKESVELRQNSAVVLDHLGDVYFKMGNQSEAQKYWLKSLELDKNNKVVEKLKEIK